MWNNLPVDVMRERSMGAGLHHCLRCHRRTGSAGPRRTLWRAAHGGGCCCAAEDAGQSSIISILMRSGTEGSEAQRRIVREQADYLIEPPMPEIGLARLEKNSTRRCRKAMTRRARQRQKRMACRSGPAFGRRDRASVCRAKWSIKNQIDVVEVPDGLIVCCIRS